MKRDMDLIRRITLAAEDLPAGAWLESLDGVDPATFSEHVRWMHEAGLADAMVFEPLAGEVNASIKRLTWDGCNFADEIRSDTLWSKAKENVLRPGMSFSFSVFREWLKTEISQGLPTIRGGG